MIKLLKQIGVVALISLGLYLLGIVIQNIVPWIWLTYFFTLLRAIVRPLDFIWDFSQVWIVLSAVFAVMIGVWGFKAFLAVRNIFSDNN